MADFSTAIQRGGVVTVMNAAVFNSEALDFSKCNTPEEAYSMIVNNNDIVCYIDHFKTANLNASGPTITITGGQDANPLIKFGKTMKCEMQMALCQIDALEALGGVSVNATKADSQITLYNGDLLIDGDVITGTLSVVNPTTFATASVSGTISGNGGFLTGVGDTGTKVTRKIKKAYTSYTVTNKFPGPVTIIGDTFVVDQKSGDEIPVKILIYKFLPDAVFNLTQDASNAATFDLNGDVLGVHFKNGTGNVYSGTQFYSVVDRAVNAAVTTKLETAIEAKKAEYKLLA
jgi:hypothetical protein